jgi:hypothetical protein
MQQLFLIAHSLYLSDKKIKRNASIVVGFTKQMGPGGDLIIHVASSYARGRELAEGLCEEHKSDFAVFDFTKYPDMKHGTCQYRDSTGS